MRKSVNGYHAQSDEQLMQLMAAGDGAAFDEVYRRYSKRLLYYFYRMLGFSQEKSQDFLQDLFLKVVEDPSRFDTSRRFSTWIFSVAHNMCKNEYRKQEVRKGMQNHENLDVVSAQQHDVDRQADLNEFNARLFAELDQLDEDRKSAFLLRHREGFSVKEVSEILDCSEGTVKSRVFYTNKLLSQKLSAFRHIADER